MNSRFGKAVIALAVVQTLILGWMVAGRVSILRSSDVVTLKSEPVDPRDIFRGDYVTLAYGISRIETERVKGDKTFGAGETVYVEITPSGKTWDAVAIHHGRMQPEEDRKIIRGRVTGTATGTNGPEILVAYGIESYFVPEGQGHALEQERNASALSVDVALAGDGEAAIKRLRVGGEPIYEEPLL